jgi:hypothetical protein
MFGIADGRGWIAVDVAGGEKVVPEPGFKETSEQIEVEVLCDLGRGAAGAMSLILLREETGSFFVEVRIERGRGIAQFYVPDEELIGLGCIA